MSVEKIIKKHFLLFLRNRKNLICSDCKRRAEKNILRVLDCKNPKCQQILNEAPQIIDYLCAGCKNHFKQVLEFLERKASIPYKLDPFLVREDLIIIVKQYLKLLLRMKL